MGRVASRSQQYEIQVALHAFPQKCDGARVAVRERRARKESMLGHGTVKRRAALPMPRVRGSPTTAGNIRNMGASAMPVTLLWRAAKARRRTQPRGEDAERAGHRCSA